MALAKVFMHFVFGFVVFITLNNIGIESKRIQVLQSKHSHASEIDELVQYPRYEKCEMIYGKWSRPCPVYGAFDPCSDVMCTLPQVLGGCEFGYTEIRMDLTPCGINGECFEGRCETVKPTHMIAKTGINDTENKDHGDSPEEMQQKNNNTWRNGTVHKNNNTTPKETSPNINENEIDTMANIFEYRINLQFYVDQAMNDTYKEKLDRHLKIIYHHVSLLFKPEKIGQRFTIRVSKRPKILPVSVFESAMQNRTQGYQSRLLLNFCEWEYSTRSGSDHLAFLITKNGLENVRERYKNVGAFIGFNSSICDPSHKCAVLQDSLLSNVESIAAKIGESLGIKHDDSSDCTDEYSSADLTGYLMSSKHFASASREWSTCSKNQLTTILSSSKVNCLWEAESQSEDLEVVKNSPQWLLAEQYNRNEQCAISLVIGSKRCPSSQSDRSCAKAMCSDPNPGMGCYENSYSWMDLTPCGKNRVCLKGQCQLLQSIEKNGVHDNSNTNVIKSNGTKVSTGHKEYRINILVYVTEDIKDEYKEKLEKYLKYIFHHVSLLYEEKRTGHRLIIAISKQQVVVPRNISQNFGNWLPQAGNTSLKNYAERLLVDFCEWQLDTRTSNDHDLAFLIQKNNLCSNEKTGYECSLKGIAQVKGICTDHKCAIAQDKFLVLPTTIAHEIADTLNVDHDENKRCTDEFPNENLRGYIMGATGVQHRPSQWSSCSKRGMTNFLGSWDGECLENNDKDFKDFEVMANSREWLMAEHFSRDEQCRIMYGNDWIFSGDDTGSTQKCDATVCLDPHTGLKLKSPGVGWHDLTSCGENHWCSEGECKAIEQM